MSHSRSTQIAAAILLVAGNKSGVSQKRFYKQLIAKADELFDAHLAALKNKEEGKEVTIWLNHSTISSNGRRPKKRKRRRLAVPRNCLGNCF